MTDKQTRRFKLNTTVNNYKVGDEVTEQEIKEFLNIQPCIDCGWLVEVKEQTLPVVDKQKIFKSVLKTLKNNKVMVDTREDGIYIRLAGRESEGEAFTLHFGLAYPFHPQPEKALNEDTVVGVCQCSNSMDSYLDGNNNFICKDCDKPYKPSPTNTPLQDKEWESWSFKDWKIVDIMDDNGQAISNPSTDVIHLCLDNKGERIRSVRREKDKEIFAIGDKISWGCTGIYETTLTGFEIRDGRLKFYDERLPENRNPCDFLDAVELHKLPTPPPTVVKDKVLFTTEDGVEIYDRKYKMWAIRKGYYELMEQHNGDWLGTWLNGWYTTQWISSPKEKDDRIIPLIKEHYFLFSTKEAADQWILENKPCLSANDIKWWLEKYFNYPNGISVNQLKELVKEKLKQ